MSEFEASRNYRTIIIAVVVISIIAVSAVGFMFLGGGGTTTTTEPTGNVITIITRHDISIHGVFEPEFLASDFAIENDIVDIKWRTPDGQFWDDIIDQGHADVLWGGGPTLFDQLMRDDRLEPLTSTLMQTAEARINDTIAGASMKRYNSDSDLVWIAAAISSFGFTVNHEFLVEYNLPTPRKWTDLANTTYGSLLPTIPTISMGNAPQTTSNTRIYEIIVQALGWNQGWITMSRMAGNAAIYPGSVETQTAAENGDVGISMSIDFYGYLTQYRNPDCSYIVPEGQSIINGDPIAIATTSPNKELSEGFIDFVLSAYGQSLWLDSDIRRMPVMSEAFQEERGLAATDLHEAFNRTIVTEGIPFDDELSLNTNGALVPYFSSVLSEAHTELVNCWAKIVEAYEDGIINATEVEYYAALMGTPVSVVDPNTHVLEKFTLAYALEINDDMIYDASFASQIKSLWTTAAKLQYQSVYDMVVTLFPR